jgi:hypothetical protein
LLNQYHINSRNNYTNGVIKKIMDLSFDAIFVVFGVMMLPLAEQELFTLPEYLRSHGFSWVRVTRSFACCVCFVDRCLSFCTFSFGQCVFCSSSIYGFWLPLWYAQAIHTTEYTTGTIPHYLSFIAFSFFPHLWLIGRFVIKQT